MKIKKHIKNIISLVNKNAFFRKEETSIYMSNYYISCDKSKFNLKTFIAIFDGKTRHGGLSDRLRGIVSLYAYCKKNSINFKILHEHPFNLTDYLLPNKYDWEIKATELSYNKKTSRPVFLFTHFLNSCYHKIYLKKFYRFSELHIYTNTDIYDNEYTELFNELFKPSTLLLDAINYNISNIGNTNFLAIVLRFQQLLGDFKEDGYEILPLEEQELLITKCLSKIKELSKNEQKVLITSDSSKFLKEASKLEYVYTIPGNVVHMDYTYDSTIEIYLKSFTDLFVLSKARKIILLKTGKMYKSGFPKRAALISNTNYEEIEF